MVLIYFSSIFMVFILFSKDIVVSESPEYCSFITAQSFKLYIFDLGDVHLKSVIFLNITEFEKYNVGEFLDYLEQVQRLHLSSRAVSLKASRIPKDVSPFAITPSSTPLCRAIDISYNDSFTDAQYTLFVGAELSPKQELMKRFLKGLLIDDNTGLFKMGILSPVIFDHSYQPDQQFPTPSINIDKQVIETFQTSKSTTSNKNSVSAEVSAYIVSVSAEYSKQKKSKSANSVKSKIAIVSLLNKKTAFIVNESRIDLHSVFIQNIYDIINNIYVSAFVRTERVVKLLNDYGWYVPNHFVLGGRFDVVKSLSESSVSKENSDLEALAGKLSAAYGMYGGSVGTSIQHGSSSATTNSFFTSNERITSTVDQAIDISSFMENVKKEENWRIIALKNILPTCQFLLKKHSNLFSEIRRLLLSNAHHQRICNLQPNLDMVKYMNDIWDAYQNTF